MTNYIVIYVGMKSEHSKARKIDAKKFMIKNISIDVMKKST